MRLTFFVLLVAIGIGLIFYLSWLPFPIFRSVPFMPKWLSDWTDDTANDTIRTGVPFVFLGLLLSRSISKVRHLWLRRWFVAWFSLIIVAIIAEAGQLSLPNRVFDWLDIVWGAIGAGIGLSFFPVCTFIIKRLKALHSD